MVGNRRYRLFYLQRITGIDDDHPGNAAHNRQIFRCLMARPVAGSQTRQRRADLYVQMLFGNNLMDKIIGAAGSKSGIGGGEGNKSLLRHSPGSPHQQLLRHPHLEEAIREGLGEDMQIGIL